MRGGNCQGQQKVGNEYQSFYTVQKILDMKEQKGKTYYLVKWLNWDVKTCTWEEEDNVQHLKSLIKDYHNSRKYDQQHNMGLKKFDYVEPGMSPYQVTKFYGHFLYGDEPKSIVSIQMIEKDSRKQMHCEVEWKARQNGFRPTNSLIESTIILDHAPQFLVHFLQSKTRLILEQYEIR